MRSPGGAVSARPRLARSPAGTTDLRVDPEGKARLCFVRSGRVLSC